MVLPQGVSVEVYLLLAILAVITFGVRVANVDGWPAFDTFGHLYFAAELRKEKHPIRDGAVMTRFAGASADRRLRWHSGYLWNAVLGKLVEPRRILTSQSVINPR